jgi:large subunit ribosomal protein L4
MPRKQRRLAIKSALTAKLQDGELVVVDSIAFDAPKTKNVIDMLSSFNTTSKKNLIITGEMLENVEKSARNIPGVKAIPASSSLNVYDLLYHDKVFVTKDAITRIEEVLA